MTQLDDWLAITNKVNIVRDTYEKKQKQKHIGELSTMMRFYFETYQTQYDPINMPGNKNGTSRSR